MLVMINKPTFFKEFLSPGSIVDVPDEVGRRWCKAGIATVEEENTAKHEMPEPPAPTPFENMTNKELFNECKKAGIVLDKERINGKTDEEKRGYLLFMLAAENPAEVAAE